ncbi:MAG: polya polymerase [Desulfobulbus propionicus]|nr:MAG: polya polymerase [Desulfobulbus propionicus]
MDKERETKVQNDADTSAYPLIIPESKHPLRESQIDREALKVLYRLRDAGFKGYLVGGGVRDLYLGKKPKDFDISTDARPGQLRKLFRNSRTIGRRFRLVQVFYRGNKTIEVSTLRSQSEYDINEPDQVLPSNNTFGTLEEDAFRRDLTINALFYEVENHSIIDYTGGVDDLDKGIIRMVGDPGRRFTRDPVRMMRAVRHASRTGFSIDAKTLAAIETHAEKLVLCPSSRLHDEIGKDLRSGACSKWAELCLQTSLWHILFPMYAQYAADDNWRQEIVNILQVVDRLYSASSGNRQVEVPEPMLFAALLLPWALRHFSLLTVELKGRMYQQLVHQIRDQLDAHITRQLHVKRAVKDGITSLLVNLPAFHRLSREKKIPKWLRRKSYYRDCSLFYELYKEYKGTGTLPVESFYSTRKSYEPMTFQAKANKHPESSSRARGRFKPAFSSKKQGVFGLRQNQG